MALTTGLLALDVAGFKAKRKLDGMGTAESVETPVHVSECFTLPR